jgi:hypothetical protein
MFSKVERILHINMNLDKCAFMVFLRMILGFIVFKKRKLPNPKKIQAIVKHPPPKNPQHIQVFNGMAQFYRTSIKNFVAIMAPKMTIKVETLFWTEEYMKPWELIKQKYIEAPILISPNW